MTNPTDWRHVTLADLYARVRGFANQHGRCVLYLVGHDWVLRSHECTQIADDFVGDFPPTVTRRQFEPAVAATILAMVRT